MIASSSSTSVAAIASIADVAAPEAVTVLSDVAPDVFSTADAPERHGQDGLMASSIRR